MTALAITLYVLGGVLSLLYSNDTDKPIKSQHFVVMALWPVFTVLAVMIWLRDNWT